MAMDSPSYSKAAIADWFPIQYSDEEYLDPSRGCGGEITPDIVALLRRSTAPSRMKRVIRYLQDQAVQAAEQKHSGSAYLSPSTKEPQQRGRHHEPSYHTHDQDHDHDQHTSRYHSRSDQANTAHTSGNVLKSECKPVSNGQRDSTRSSPCPSVEKIQRDMTRHQYAQDNILQSYDLYIPELEASHLATDPAAQRYWVLYVHGGYFRDPAVTSASFLPALSLLVSSSAASRTAQNGKQSPFRHRHRTMHRTKGSPQEKEEDDDDGHDADSSHPLSSASAYISGYASINYRLSPHAQKAPQDASKTPSYELRNAQWPEPLHDVLSAIAHLQGKYHFGTRYLLVGHSVGATMAVLSTLSSGGSLSFSSSSSSSPIISAHNTRSGQQQQPQWPKIDPPMAVLGVAGIYDFPLLHGSFSAYQGLTRNAIPDERDDAAASPARYGVREYRDSWARGVQGGERGGQGKRGGKEKRALILAHSRDDGLVDWKQVEAMRDVFAVDKIGIKGEGEGEGEGEGKDGDEGDEGDEGQGKGESGGEAGGDNPRVGVGIDVRILEIKGSHNDIWSRGVELARAISQAVLTMRSLEAG